jgi:TetR/AcrR family transcriptional regulator, transcriptional repressor for nem operon
MGRRPSYEIDDVYRASVTLFRAQGFHQVSVPDLLSATGLNRFALYEKFGGKEGLFYDTLDYYHRVMVRGQLLGPLYRERASVGSVLRMLQMLRRINRDPKSRPGCLIMNANIELGGHDERVAEAVEFVVGTFREAVEHALTRAEQRGELRGPKPAKELAARTALSIQAFFSLAYISRQAADQLLVHLIDEVSTWKAESEETRAVRTRDQGLVPVS